MFIRWMEAHARRGWFIGDLHRHWLPYYGFGVLAWLARWHHFVLSDGRISIARAFVPEEWRRLMSAAGLGGTRRRHHLASAVPALRRAALSGPVIIGGGPAGTAAAIALARAGQAVTLIERNVDTSDKVCGDFLSAEALAMVEGLGVDLSAASTISAVRLVHRNRSVTTHLPFAARGLSRRVLDEALLRQAQAGGATVLRGHRVSAIEQDRASHAAVLRITRPDCCRDRVPRHGQARAARRGPTRSRHRHGRHEDVFRAGSLAASGCCVTMSS